MKVCDNASVGVLIERKNRFLMFERQTFPPGIAPPAGHIDDHGSVELAAVAEVYEEVGLEAFDLTRLWSGWLDNRCRRPGGHGHHWTVFQASADGSLNLGKREAANAAWLTRDRLQILANRTVLRSARPGLEPVWCVLLHQVGVIRLAPGELDIVAQDFLVGPDGVLA